MAYIIDYIIEENILKNPSKLVIYDFGHIKGFLYNDEFKMYKIINKEDSKEICELYNGPIPLHVISKESYDCEDFKTANFTINIKQQRLQQPQPLVAPPQPSQQYQQRPLHQQRQQLPRPQVRLPRQSSQQQEEKVLQTPQPQQPLNKSMKSNFLQLGEQINEMYKKTQQVELHQQKPLKKPNAPQQWKSLEDLAQQLPSLVAVGGPHQQPSLKVQSSVVLMKQKKPLLVRRHQQQISAQHQDSTC